MENKINSFKVKPLTAFLIILLVALIIFVVFQLGELRKPQKVFHPPEVVKEEALPVTEAKLQPEEKPPLSLEKKFTIQVASFQDKARAELVSEELRKKGYVPVISAKDLGNKGIWYRVWVGDFESEEKARELLKTLKEDYKDSFIKLL